jgi:hypothetical protein
MKIRRYGTARRCVFAQHHCGDARIDGGRGIIFLTMKIVQILGKIVENLPRT